MGCGPSACKQSVTLKIPFHDIKEIQKSEKVPCHHGWRFLMNKKGSTKQFIYMALIIILAGSLGIYRLIMTRSHSIIYEGTIISITQNDDSFEILVDGVFLKSAVNENKRMVTHFTIHEDTDISSKNGDLNVEELALGNEVKLEGPDVFRESYPLQGDATKVTLLSEVSRNFLIRGEVMEVIPSSGNIVLQFLVKGSVTGYQEETQVYVSVPKDSYYPFGIHEGSGMLIPGDEVQVLVNGAMAESYPMQAISSSVLITKIRTSE